MDLLIQKDLCVALSNETEARDRLRFPLYEFALLAQKPELPWDIAVARVVSPGP